jgi:hypothetical protein
MAKTVPDLLNAADHEWQHWGKSTWNVATGAKAIGHTDDETTFAQFIIDNYCAIVGDKPPINEISDDVYFWSAVGISAMFKAAGFDKPEFPFSNSHSTWIRQFIKARRANKPALYWGFRVTEAQATPDVGDTIGCARLRGLTFEKAQAFFDKTERYPSHSDIVVARRPGEIDVIGANVLDSVTKKTLKLTPAGLVADRSHLWFAVLKRKGF